MVAWDRGWGWGWGYWLEGGMKELSWEMAIFFILTGVVITGVNTFVEKVVMNLYT